MIKPLSMMAIALALGACVQNQPPPATSGPCLGRLREALAAFIAGKPVPAPGGEAFGCPLPEVSKKPRVE